MVARCCSLRSICCRICHEHGRCLGHGLVGGGSEVYHSIHKVYLLEADDFCIYFNILTVSITIARIR